MNGFPFFDGIALRGISVSPNLYFDIHFINLLANVNELYFFSFPRRGEPRSMLRVFSYMSCS